MMIRACILALTLTASAVSAQATDEGCAENSANPNDEADCPAVLQNADPAALAAEEGVTGFVPLVAPALGAVAAVAGVAAAGGGGSATSTSTTSTN